MMVLLRTLVERKQLRNKPAYLELLLATMLEYSLSCICWQPVFTFMFLVYKLTQCLVFVICFTRMPMFYECSHKRTCSWYLQQNTNSAAECLD